MNRIDPKNDIVPKNGFWYRGKYIKAPGSVTKKIGAASRVTTPIVEIKSYRIRRDTEVAFNTDVDIFINGLVYIGFKTKDGRIIPLNEIET